MRKMILAAVLAAALCGMAFGQGSSVALQNQESFSFYYVLDPQALAGLTTGDPLLATKVADFFTAPPDGVAFASLAPETMEKVDGLASGTHLLVGFFAVEGQKDFPVRVMSLQADDSIGVRLYTIFASPAQLSIALEAGRLESIARAAEVAAAKAAALKASRGLSPVATFASSYSPAVFTRERQGSFDVLPISESLSWALTGTRVQALSALMDSGALRVTLTVQDGFVENVSYFFYIFSTRSMGTDDQLTFELEPRANGNYGACLLWQQGAAAPRIIGSVKTSGTSAELDIASDQMPADVLAAIGDNATIDFTAGWYDRALGTWEEFYYTTFTINDIPAAPKG